MCLLTRYLSLTHQMPLPHLFLRSTLKCARAPPCVLYMECDKLVYQGGVCQTSCTLTPLAFDLSLKCYPVSH